MKHLLVITLLTAGTTAHSIGPRAVLQFGNVIKCPISGSHPLKEYDSYVLFCLLRGSDTLEEEFKRCCQIRDHCYAQVKKLESCKFLIDNPYTLYAYSCSGNEITCSDKNNLCEFLICSCDHQVAMCFSKAPYNKQ